MAFSTPGVKYPDDEIPDDELMDALKKLIDERTEKQRQITDLKDQIKQLNGQEKKGDKAIRTLKTHLSESQVGQTALKLVLWSKFHDPIFHIELYA